MKNNPFTFILDQIENNLPESLRPLQSEVKTTLRGLVDDKLAQLDYVPRAEFEAQLALLASAEARITDLEQKIIALEQQHAAKEKIIKEEKEKKVTNQDQASETKTTRKPRSTRMTKTPKETKKDSD